MRFEKIGTFEETRYNDTVHTVYDAGLKSGATLHRFINGGGDACSAIYIGDVQYWWTYTNGTEYIGDETAMIKEWNERDVAGKDPQP